MFVALLLLLQGDVPTLTHPVTDLAGAVVPRPVDEELTRAIDALQATDSTQVVLLVLATTAGVDIAQYAHATAAHNGIGQKDKNNGILIVVAVDDRRVRIEVGYGLEGVLPDALCDQIIRKEMVPHFKSKDYATGIRKGVLAVIGAVKGEYKADPKAKFEKLGTYVFWGVFVLLIVLSMRGGGLPGRRSRYGGYGWIPLSGGRSHSGGGSGWSGGGGSFGGGGASGSW